MVHTHARTKVTTPLIGAGILAGMLMILVVGVIYQAAKDTGSTEPITQQVDAGLADVAWVAVPSNNIAGALPAFTLNPTATPLQLGNWANPEWLDTSIDEKGHRWVWASGWYACRWVALGNDGYSPPDDSKPGGWDWLQLGAITRRDIKELCHGQ